MFNWKNFIKALFVIALIITVGIFEFSSFFSDLGPNETYLERFIVTGLIFFVAGLIIGYLYPKKWYLSGLTVWSLTIVGILIIISPPETPTKIPEGAQKLSVIISEDQIKLSSTSIKPGGFYVEQINEGVEEHELAFYVKPKDFDINLMTLDNFHNNGIKASLRPLNPDETDVASFGGDYFGTGQYILLCLKRTKDGKSHFSRGEIAEFSISD